MGRLNGKRIAILATDGFEQSELSSPKHALENEGAKVEVISPHLGTIRGWKDKNWAESIEVTSMLGAADPADYDALMLPGGVMNPDHLRSTPAAVEFVAAFVEARKPIAAICHGPWTLIEAGAAYGRKMTSYHSIKTDLINAGAEWVDEAFVIDRGVVTSRSPNDLPVFNEKMIEVFAEGQVSEEPRPKRKKSRAVSTHARAKASPRKAATRGKLRGTKQAPRRRAPKRR